MKSGTYSEMLRAGTTLKCWHLDIGNNPGQGTRIVSSILMPSFQLKFNKTTNRGKAILLALCPWLFPLIKHCKRFNKNTNVQSTRGRQVWGRLHGPSHAKQCHKKIFLMMCTRGTKALFLHACRWTEQRQARGKTKHDVSTRFRHQRPGRGHVWARWCKPVVCRWWRRRHHCPSATVAACPLPGGGWSILQLREGFRISTIYVTWVCCRLIILHPVQGYFWHARQRSDAIRVMRLDRWVRSEVVSLIPHWDMRWQCHHIITTSLPGCRTVFLHRCLVLDKQNMSD